VLTTTRCGRLDTDVTLIRAEWRQGYGAWYLVIKLLIPLTRRGGCNQRRGVLNLEGFAEVSSRSGAVLMGRYRGNIGDPEAQAGELIASSGGQVDLHLVSAWIDDAVGMVEQPRRTRYRMR
jgi:hypothetical protein